MPSARGRSNAVESAFIKRGAGSCLAVEREKTIRARIIGEASSLFYVPKVLPADDSEVLCLERLQGIISFRSLLESSDSRVLGVASALGGAIAEVHRQLTLPAILRTEMPPPWGGIFDEPNVCLHGDLTSDNVHFIPGLGRPVLLDWSFAPRFGRTYTHGSPYFDLVWFMAHLSRSTSLIRQPLLRLRPVFDAFLGGYSVRRPGVLSRQRLSMCMGLLMPLYREEVEAASLLRSSWSRWLYRQLHIRRMGWWCRYVLPAVPDGTRHHALAAK